MRAYLMNLHLFDGEGSAAGPAGGMGVSGIASADGVDGSANQTGVDGPANQTGEEVMSFEDLINSPQYKDEANKYISSKIRDRVKKSNDTIKAQGDILAMVASKYGMDTSDLAKLHEAVASDESYYEDVAIREGLTIDQAKRLVDAERKSQAYEEQIKQAEQERQVQEQVAAWRAEAEQVKQIFPDFDLQKEMQNPTFNQMLRQGYGMRQAYVSMHDLDILQGAMGYTAAAVREATANEIASRGSRPREAATANRASATVRTDVSKLTKADREELSRRALAGETIDLSNLRL